jgi:hypothetical protein
VDTDRPIKVLFERQSQSLLPFIGERGPTFASPPSSPSSSPCRPAGSTRCCLERDGLVWYRHLEFEAQRDPDMPRRCFEYNSRLILHYDAAVLTTVLYLFPGADRDVPDAFRLYVGDWLAYEWRFDVVRLWEIEVEAFERRRAAARALLRGGDEPPTREAARKPDALPSVGALTRCRSDDLASQRYDRGTFPNVLERTGQQSGSGRWRQEGEAKGRINTGRVPTW